MSVSEPDPSGFTRAEFESMYWAILDFLTIPEQPDAKRRRELRGLVDKLSTHVRSLRGGGPTAFGSRVIKRVNFRDIVRARLLTKRDPNEESIWSVYGEEPDAYGDLMLLTVTGGKYRDVVEFALDQPEFITRGMGGQIDRLGE